LTTGLIPLLNTVNGTSGSLLVQNAGNQNAVLGSASADAGISNLSGCSGETLAPAASCTISFNVTESGGSGNITIPYTGGSTSSIAANVTWFNGVGAALVSMSASNNPLTFSATVVGSTTVTVQNIGGYTLRNISVPAPVVVGGSATATLANNNCAESVILPVGSSCSYDVEVADSATDLNQQINLGFSASYAGPNGTQAYSRVMPLAYSSTAYGAIIAITPTDPSLTISGNNFESTTQVLTISNSGNLPANISNTLSSNPAYLTESATTCGETLAAETSCTSTIQFGPTYSAAGASGASNYTVDYTAVGQTPSGSMVSSIDWTVQSYAQSISLTSVDSSGAASGDGLSGTPYIFSGSSNASKLVTLTYTNTGTNSLKITGIQESNSVYAWSMPGDGNHCDNNVILPPNGTCSIQFENVLATNILALGASVGATYTENINVPTLSYQDAINSQVQFNAQPNLPTGGTIIYAQSNQATLANTVTVNDIGTSNEAVTVSHLLANAGGYADISVTTQMEDYFIVPTREVGTPDVCTSNYTNGILTQTCTLSSSELIGEGTYQVNQTLLNASTGLNLTALFSTNALEQGLIVSMNPIFAISNLGSSPSIVAVGTAGAILTSRDGVTWESTNYGSNYLNGITYADNQFVAVGEAGAVYTSTNGLSWATQTSGTAEELFEVTHGSNLFVSVGCQGTIITSQNAKSWSSQSAIDNCDIYGVTYGNNLYVASGLGGRIQTSSDGFTWTAQASGVSDELTAVTYGNGLYVAVGTNGAILTSPDGVTWTFRVSNTTAQIGSILYAGGQFVAGVRDGTILTSPDGISWTSRVTNNVNPLYGIAYSNGKYIAVGTLGTILTSLDGVTWVTRESITSESLYGVVGLSSL
jgi:hypothetical protein